MDREEVQKVVHRHAASLDVDPDGIVVRGPIRRGRYSNVYKADVPGLATCLAIKCLIEGETGQPDGGSASRQFHALDRVHRRMGRVDGYGVPRPYFLAEDEGIIAIEWIEGRAMTDAFLSPALAMSEAVDAMRRAAIWLRHFCDAGPKSSGPLNVQEKLVQIDAVERTLYRFASARDACSALRQHAASAADCELERSWLHGDFKADNLLVDERCTTGIDLHVRHVNAVAHDAAAFLNHWELTLCHPLAWRWKPRNADLRRVFLESFDGAYLHEKRIPFCWTALLLMLGNWTEFTGRERKTVGHVYLRSCFKAIVRRMTKQLTCLARVNERAPTPQ